MSLPWTINISKNCRANQGHKIGNIQGSDISDFLGAPDPHGELGGVGVDMICIFQWPQVPKFSSWPILEGSNFFFEFHQP